MTFSVSQEMSLKFWWENFFDSTASKYKGKMNFDVNFCNGPGQCSLAGFDVSGVESSGSAATVLVQVLLIYLLHGAESFLRS